MASTLDPALLAGLVVGGVGLVVVLTHLTGGTVTAKVQDTDDARDRFGLDFPDEAVEEVVLADDQHSALLALRGGSTGVVFAVGDKLVARRLRRVRVTAEGDELRLRLGDFGAPEVRIRLADADARSGWSARLKEA